MLRELLVVATGLALTMGAVLGSTAPAQASLVDNGITYTLTETATSNPLTNQFTLGISGINGSLDTEGGRYGVQSFAFNKPANFSSATPPSGFTEQAGGLNASGCNGHGNFFCFSANTTPTTLLSGSTLSYAFDITLSSGSFSTYDPDFKINWVGTKNHYDLVSLPLAPTPGTVPSVPVPEPGSLIMLGTGLLGLSLVLKRRFG